MARDCTEGGSIAALGPPKLDIDADALQFAFQASHVGNWVWDTGTEHIHLSEFVLERLQLSAAEVSNDERRCWN